MLTKTPTLSNLRSAHENSYESLLALISRKHPGQTIGHWYRACAAERGDNVRYNDDTSRDALMANDAEVIAAHDEYIRLLHIFYRARDGEHGVLGGRGL